MRKFVSDFEGQSRYRQQINFECAAVRGDSMNGKPETTVGTRGIIAMMSRRGTGGVKVTRERGLERNVEKGIDVGLMMMGMESHHSCETTV